MSDIKQTFKSSDMKTKKKGASLHVKAFGAKQTFPIKNENSQVSYEVTKSFESSMSEGLTPNCPKWYIHESVQDQSYNGENGLLSNKLLVSQTNKKIGKKIMKKKRKKKNSNKVLKREQSCAKFTNKQMIDKQIPQPECLNSFISNSFGSSRSNEVRVCPTNSYNSQFSYLEDMTNANNLSEQNIRISISGSQSTHGKETFSSAECNSGDLQKTFFKDHHCQPNTNFNTHAESVFQSNKAAGMQRICEETSINKIEDDTFIDLKRNNFNESTTNYHNQLSFNKITIPDKSLVLKLNENANSSQSFLDFSGHINSGALAQNLLKNMKNSLGNLCVSCSDLSKISLQIIMENFIKNSHFAAMKHIPCLKKGLGCNEMKNNCQYHNHHCSRNVYQLYAKKLKNYPSKFIMALVVSVRSDIHFVDIVMAALKVLSERNTPIIWVTFLAFFVFYVAEPFDRRFLKFWQNAAGFFCQLSPGRTVTNGFANLLSIFIEGDKSERWKIFEFISLIKQPPIQINVTYTLLEPVLKVDVPLHILTAAVESCLKTRRDVLKVDSEIVGKISLANAPIHVVELLFKFCKTLETVNEDSANFLRHRLKAKVLSFEIKIDEHEYPITASHQIEQSRNSPHTDVLIFESSTNDDEDINIPDSNGEAAREQQLNQIKVFFAKRQFFSLGKYLNELMSGILMTAAEKILKSLFQMTISFPEAVDVIKIMLLSCETENAATVMASICITLILHLVKINEWDNAYTLLSLCKRNDGKQIDLVRGSVFTISDKFISITQCRVALLLVEVYAHKEKYKNAIQLIENCGLFSPQRTRWKVSSSEGDNVIRIRILEELLEKIIYSQLAEIAHDLFAFILTEQKKLHTPFDLSKFADEVLILLLNHQEEDALLIYDKIKSGIKLKTGTVRAILVAMVRYNHMDAARNLVLSFSRTIYRLPAVTCSSLEMVVSCFWLEEEIYAVFYTLFDMVASEKCKSGKNGVEYQIHINVSLVDGTTFGWIKPLCLCLVNPTFDQVCARIGEVLKYRFSPPIELNVTTQALEVNHYSLQRHLCSRIQ